MNVTLLFVVLFQSAKYRDEDIGDMARKKGNESGRENVTFKG